MPWLTDHTKNILNYTLKFMDQLLLTAVKSDWGKKVVLEDDVLINYSKSVSSTFCLD